jgi:hypothetical protein
MGYDEITRRIPGGKKTSSDRPYESGEELVFARTNKRRWYLGEDEVGDKPPLQAVTYVQQYKFIRLDRRANYEPLIMCLKGLQMAYNPADYLTAEQLSSSVRLQQEYKELKEWAAEPTQISPRTINSFIKTIQDGLMNEGHHRPVHELHYIDWVLNAVNVQLNMFNKQVRQPLTGSAGRRPAD